MKNRFFELLKKWGFSWEQVEIIGAPQEAMEQEIEDDILDRAYKFIFDDDPEPDPR